MLFRSQMFTRAIAIDPTYARAYAGLADCYSLLYTNFGASAVHLQQAEEASRKALELGPELAEAHAARGIAVSHDTVWRFLRREGRSFKKKRIRQ